MVSIFKAVRDNNVETIENLISLASKGDRQSNTRPQGRPAKPTTKPFNLNKRSLHGRTALHLAATWNRVQIAKLLIDCPLVNVNLQDLENGWTALHKALYAGNVEIAIMLLQREDIDLTIKDWEGLRAFELYSLTVRDVFPRYPEAAARNGKVDYAAVSNGTKLGGTELYSWGSNTNYVLGHRDPDNRTNPDRVPLDLESHRTNFIMQRPNVKIESVQMSKYHTAVITDEPTRNLLICGFGRGGRLGTGSSAETQLTLTPVSWSERILSVALGKNHTIAVTESRNVISFGDNTFGQLGYETEDVEQFVPRRIQAACLKKQPIIGVAASAAHSVVYTSTDLFTFGLNQGQLGYHASGDDNRQMIPRKVGFSVPIKQVVANDFATAILSESNDITLLTNYTQTKLFLPISRFPSNIQVHSSSPKYPVRLLGSGSEHLGALTSSGDVYLWQCKGNSAALRSKSKLVTNTTQPKRVWTCRKWHMAAIDACIGLHGGLIVCTRSGQVLVGSSTKDSSEGNYKFTIIPYLQRCIQVCASPSGAFAAIRSELTTRKIEELPSTLLYDLASSLPHVRASKQLDNDIADLTRQRSDRVEKMEAKIKLLEERKEEQAKELMQGVNEWFQEQLSKVIASAWERIEAIAIKDETLDVTIKLGDGRQLYCHQYIFAVRSPVFCQILQKRSSVAFEGIEIELDRGKMAVITLKKAYDLVAILLFMDYLYTDTYSHPMNAFYQVPNLCRGMDSPGTPNSVQKDLVELASLFGLEELKVSASSSFSHKPRPTLEKCLSKLLTDQVACDVQVEMQDKDQVLCHEMVLRQRSPFFGALFEPGSIWVEERRKQQSSYVSVDVTDLRKPVFSLILKYLYEDCSEEELFGHITESSVEGMMNYILEVLAAADELLLTRLKRICERALLPFLRLRTATLLLEKSNMYQADALKDRCLYFVASNLDYLLTTGALDSLDVDLIHDLEKYIRADQVSESRIGRLFEPDATMDDEEFSESLYAQSREDISPIANFAEVLTTIYPEKKLPTATPTPTKSPEVDDTMVFHMDEDTPEAPKPQKEKRLVERREKNTTATATKRPSIGGNGVPWTTQGLSIESAEQKVSLREYLEQQQQQQQSKSPNLSSTPPMAFPKHSPPFTTKKLSQKERRKLQQQQELAAAAAATPKPVWGKVMQVAKTPPEQQQQPWPSLRSNSFEAKQDPIQTRTPMSNENGVVEAESSSKGKKIYVTKEELLKEMPRPGDVVSENKQDNSFDPMRSLGPTFAFTPIRKSKNGAAVSKNTPVAVAARSFHEIQKQQELEDLWIKGKKFKKSLLQIQIEERAIENLTEYYVQTMDAISGEWFEIHRIDS